MKSPAFDTFEPINMETHAHPPQNGETQWDKGALSTARGRHEPAPIPCLLRASCHDLEQRTRIAELNGLVSLALIDRSTPLQVMLQQCAEAIHLKLQTALVRIWTLDEPQQMLELN